MFYRVFEMFRCKSSSTCCLPNCFTVWTSNESFFFLSEMYKNSNK